jgi:hypothetical protein
MPDRHVLVRADELDAFVDELVRLLGPGARAVPAGGEPDAAVPGIELPVTVDGRSIPVVVGPATVGEVPGRVANRSGLRRDWRRALDQDSGLHADAGMFARQDPSLRSISL